jgi:hypothetical protein
MTGTPYRSPAVPAEPVALRHSRTAPPTPHATLPTLSTLTLVKPRHVTDSVGPDGTRALPFTGSLGSATLRRLRDRENTQNRLIPASMCPMPWQS